MARADQGSGADGFDLGWAKVILSSQFKGVEKMVGKISDVMKSAKRKGKIPPIPKILQPPAQPEDLKGNYILDSRNAIG
jgi:hypothetical protein